MEWAVPFDYENLYEDRKQDWNSEYFQIAYTIIATRVIEAFVRKFSILPTFNQKDIDKWFKTYPIARKNAIVQRQAFSDPKGAGYIFYRSTVNPSRPIVKSVGNIAYVREDDDYEISECIINVANTYISQFPNYYIVSYYKLVRASESKKKGKKNKESPKDEKDGKQNERTVVQHTYKLHDNNDDTTKEMDEVNADIVDQINKEVQERYGVQLYKPEDLEGFERIPVVLFKNEYQGGTLLDVIWPIIRECAKVIEEMDDNLQASGPFWMIVSRELTQNNKNSLATQLGKSLATHTEDGKRTRFVVMPQQMVATRYESITDTVANLSTNPQFEQYIKVIEMWTEKAMKAVMAPAGTEGHQGVKNQTTSEVGASNQNTDDTISLFKRILNYQWYRFAEAWYMTAGIPMPEDLEVVLEDLKTQNEMIQEQKTDQENDFTKGKGKEKLQKAEDGKNEK